MVGETTTQDPSGAQAWSIVSRTKIRLAQHESDKKMADEGEQRKAVD